MYRYNHSKFDKEILDISPGEYFASQDDIVISTLLGSCVSVVIYDSHTKMGGMNHFMLVEGIYSRTSHELLQQERYGSFAMESLLNVFYKGGSLKHNLSAKIFGGSKLFQLDGGLTQDIGKKNIIYAREFLHNEGIPILNENTGGAIPRRIFLYPHNFKVYLKKNVYNSEESLKRIKSSLESYQSDLKKKSDQDRITLFS